MKTTTKPCSRNNGHTDDSNLLYFVTLVRINPMSEDNRAKISWVIRDPLVIDAARASVRADAQKGASPRLHLPDIRLPDVRHDDAYQALVQRLESATCRQVRSMHTAPDDDDAHGALTDALGADEEALAAFVNAWATEMVSYYLTQHRETLTNLAR